jgi:steroid 5-alpha reductase family enzyme
VIVAATGATLIVTGAITACAFAAVLAPAIVLRLLFGVTSPDQLTIMIARHWALLVTLVGWLLVYAAYHPEVRLAIMIAAVVEKLALGVLVFASPWRRSVGAATVAGGDTIIALLYIWILSGVRSP